jgi:hypothetical protein
MAAVLLFCGSEVEETAATDGCTGGEAASKRERLE